MRVAVCVPVHVHVRMRMGVCYDSAPSRAHIMCEGTHVRMHVCLYHLNKILVTLQRSFFIT